MGREKTPLAAKGRGPLESRQGLRRLRGKIRGMEGRAGNVLGSGWVAQMKRDFQVAIPKVPFRNLFLEEG